MTRERHGALPSAVRVSFEPDLRVGRSQSESAATLLLLLDGIRRSGSIAEAARAAGCSYRHAWGLIGRWKDILGQPLASLRQGRSTRLTPLGEHLLWVDRQVRLRVAPLFAELSEELERELAEVFEIGSKSARGRKRPNSRTRSVSDTDRPTARRASSQGDPIGT